ncbi:MAG: hypothetical protein ABH824_02265 [Nanoarchaeota archaeon]|nr:hypothetical protein [Nanoarchaeota archaeon]MBU1632202.1 hypothetical protein [Nanoarchaeota archaeon]MBU1875577.1 hypothetical protein [Nanoarchaeota archaeon]
MGEGCCSCDCHGPEDKIRDLINLINVYKEEEKEGVTTKIDPKTAKELVKELEKLAVIVGNICE